VASIPAVLQGWPCARIHHNNSPLPLFPTLTIYYHLFHSLLSHQWSGVDPRGASKLTVRTTASSEINVDMGWYCIDEKGTVRLAANDWCAHLRLHVHSYLSMNDTHTFLHSMRVPTYIQETLVTGELNECSFTPSLTGKRMLQADVLELDMTLRYVFDAISCCYHRLFCCIDIRAHAAGRRFRAGHDISLRFVVQFCCCSV
jgi:hypothetical protein